MAKIRTYIISLSKRLSTEDYRGLYFKDSLKEQSIPVLSKKRIKQIQNKQITSKKI